MYLLIEARRNFLASALVYGAVFYIWSSHVLLQFDHADSETTKEPNQDRGTDENDANNQYHTEELDEEDGFFIPLSLPFLRPGKFYAETDPEWQVFQKMSGDKQKIQLLKGMRNLLYACLDFYAYTFR